MSTVRITSAGYPNLFQALEHLADDNNLQLRNEIDIPKEWQERCATAEREAARMRDRPVGYFMPIEPQMKNDVEADDDALEYVVNGEQTIVEKLIEAAECQTLHQLLSEAFDGVLYNSIFVIRRMRHAR